MKIAFLLTLYTLPEQANIFINQLLEYKESYVFIHIDKKFELMRKNLIKNERVVIIDELEYINWGDFSQIQSVLNLMEYAVKFGEFDYFSINSGHDLLVRPIDELIEFLQKDNSIAYLDCNKLPADGWQYNGGLGRVELKWPKIFRKKISKNSPLRYLRKLYVSLYEFGIIKGKKLSDNMNFYGGSDWFTVNGEAVNYILTYIKNNPEYKKIFEEALIGSEIFFNTIICNKYSSDRVVTTDNLRYIDWSRDDGQAVGSPRTLVSDDYKSIKKSNKFFARKFDIRKDYKIINKFVDDNI